LKKIPMVIFGVSGHAKVILDIIESGSSYELLGFIDNEAPIGTNVLGYKVLGNDPSLPKLMEEYNFNKGIIGIGDNFIRSKVANFVGELVPNFQFVNCIHPSANISKHCQLGLGNVVMAGVSINPSVKISDHCILNTNCSLDHDCCMGNYSCLAPNSVVGGNTRIGDYSYIGIGCTVFHNIEIGKNCIVGGGSLVIRDTSSDSVFFGSPAKFISSRILGDKYL